VSECFACFSDMCPACEGDGCMCSHTSYEDPKPLCGGESCMVIRTLTANASYEKTKHAAGCPARLKAAALAPGQHLLFGNLEADR
jgi:hypothetical protein